MLPGQMQLSNAINYRAAHDYANYGTIKATMITVRNPLPEATMWKAGPEGSQIGRTR